MDVSNLRGEQLQLVQLVKAQLGPAADAMLAITALSSSGTVVGHDVFCHVAKFVASW